MAHREDRPGRGGRTRDPARGAAIVEVAIEVLAEVGYDALTMELVAARAGAGKATLYRRWSSKDDLVLDVVDRIRRDAHAATLPDTHGLRGDLVALARSSTADGRAPAVLAGLAAVVSRRVGLADAATAAVVEPWTAAHRTLIRRAVARGELPDTDTDLIDTVAAIVPALLIFRLLVARRPVDLDDLLALIDHVVLPALHARTTPSPFRPTGREIDVIPGTETPCPSPPRCT